jgi:DNA-binding MarR family transcriptional regulator
VARLEAGVAPSDELELERVFQTFLRSARAKFQEVAGTVGLTPPQLLVLSRIASLSRPTPGDLAAEIGVTPAAVTFLVTELEEQGLVRGSRGAPDARQVVLGLTAAGRRRLAAARREGKKLHAVIRDEFTEEGIRALRSSLLRLVVLFDGPAPSSSGRTAVPPPDRPPRPRTRSRRSPRAGRRVH